MEGTVTLEGKKLAGVTVEFTPLGVVQAHQAPPSRAVTDEEGHFTLTADDNRPGAVVCRHRVTVRPTDNEDPAAKLPFVYALSGTTPLYVEVTADQHTYDLKLMQGAKPFGGPEEGD